MKELQEDFASCLHFASAEEPLFIFLDSLDQFGPEDNARQLAWLPTVLPSHVKLAVSTLPNSEYECFPILQVRKELFRVVREIRSFCFNLNSNLNQNFHFIFGKSIVLKISIQLFLMRLSRSKDSPSARFIC